MQQVLEMRHARRLASLLQAQSLVFGKHYLFELKQGPGDPLHHGAFLF